MKIYIDCGGVGVDKYFQPAMLTMVEKLTELGYQQEVNLLSIVDPDAKHNEKEWAARAAGFLNFMYGKK